MPNVSAEDLANAEVELSEAKRFQDSTTTARAVDANDPTATLRTLQTHGLTEMPATTEPGKVNPDIMRIVYHAYDGRVVPIPEYMAKVRLAERFPREDFIPAQYHGKRVWFLEPQPVMERSYYKCLLHADQTEDVKAEVRESGYRSGACSYAQGPSIALVEKHMALKHKDEWKALQLIRTKKEHSAEVSNAERQTEAILKLAEALAAQNLAAKK